MDSIRIIKLKDIYFGTMVYEKRDRDLFVPILGVCQELRNYFYFFGITVGSSNLTP